MGLESLVVSVLTIERIRRVLPFIAATLSLGVAAVATLTFNQQRVVTEASEKALWRELFTTRAQELADKKWGPEASEIKRLREQVDGILAHPNDVQVQAVAATVDSIDKRLAKLEQVIMADPEKALTVPLLRKELAAINDARIADHLAAKESVDRVYTLAQWLLGGICTSLFLLAVTAAVGRKRD